MMPGHWERAELPLDLARRLGELGLVGDGIEGYGCPPMSIVAAGLIQMELSRGDGSLGVLLGVQAGLAMRSIAMLGSEEQKQRWLPSMARMESLGAFALTEPDHGSDSVSLETTARREGDEYVIDGAKRWIGNGTVADVVVAWARDAEDHQVKGFLVEQGTPGFNARVIEGKGSVRSVWQADIEFDRRAGSGRNRLPGANTFKDAGKVLASTRLTVAFGGARARRRLLRRGALLLSRAAPVRQAAGQLPDRAGAARADARRGDLDAAVSACGSAGSGSSISCATRSPAWPR